MSLRIRAGIHAGETELRDNDVTHVAVQLAARVEQATTTATVRDVLLGADTDSRTPDFMSSKASPHPGTSADSCELAAVGYDACSVSAALEVRDLLIEEFFAHDPVHPRQPLSLSRTSNRKWSIASTRFVMPNAYAGVPRSGS